MMRWLLKLICKHDYEMMYGTEKLLGQTLNWALVPTNEYEADYQCTKCGKVTSEKYIYYGGYVPREFRK